MFVRMRVCTYVCLALKYNHCSSKLVCCVSMAMPLRIVQKGEGFVHAYVPYLLS